MRKYKIDTNSKQCILFFNGWSMDENILNNLDSTGFDVIVFYDYSDFNLVQDDFSKYEKLFLVAWSLGVYVVSQSLWLKDLKFEEVVAINGTVHAIDKVEGIFPQVFEKTLTTLSEKTKQKFDMRCFGGTRNFKLNENLHSNRSFESQLKELSFLHAVYQKPTHSSIQFTKAIVGTNDLIFTPKNQMNYWNKKVTVKEVELDHNPFVKFSSWNEIIEL